MPARAAVRVFFCYCCAAIAVGLGPLPYLRGHGSWEVAAIEAVIVLWYLWLAEHPPRAARTHPEDATDAR